MLRRAVASAVVVGLLVITVAGCAVGTPAPPPATDSPVSAVGVPAGGVRLADLGFEYGPVEAITVPAEVQIGLRVDQPNMVTVMFGAPAGEVIAAWLGDHLTSGGFHITAANEQSVVFDGYGWTGAFTISADGSALTLRRSPA